jgi:hypothetical protein
MPQQYTHACSTPQRKPEASTLNAIDGLAGAHARTLEKVVACEFQRQTRRMPFATSARVCGIAAELIQDFAEDLLNDFLMLAERRNSAPGTEWVMAQLTDALVSGAAAIEAAAPTTLRGNVANVLQICRVDFEWRCRATLGLPSATTLGEEPGAENQRPATRHLEH